MKSTRHLATAFFASVSLFGSAAAQVAPPTRDSVPVDLRPLLAPRRSEMRLVSLRYTADRNLLVGNYAGNAGGGRGGGRGGAPAPDTSLGPPVVVSANRIARLRQFDANWQHALAAIDAAKLTPPARSGLDSLRGLVAANIARADVEAKDLGRLLYVFPFAPKLVGLLEERLRLADVKPERAAGLLTEITAQVEATRARFRAGLTSDADSLPRANRVDALRSAAAIDALRANLGAWNGFYNGYDPMFTWWMPLPFKRADSALASYSGFLRDSVATANKTSSFGKLPRLRTFDPGRPLVPEPEYVGTFDPNYFLAMGISYSRPNPIDFTADELARARADSIRSAVLHDVPDLAAILELSQDEMSDVVSRYLGRGANGGRGGGGRGNGAPNNAPVPLRDSVFYNNWLGALKTLDFDNLSRNAQVDYLYLKHNAELQLARQGHDIPPNQPRKTDNTGIPGNARGREGLIRDLQDEMIPYTPEQLMALAEREFAWTTAEMIKASRQMGFGDNWKAAVEKVKTQHPPPGGQPAAIRDLIYQAIDYLREKDLITVPAIAAESQRMSMMSAQAQLSNPFFLGGSEIQVSYPVDGQEFDAREQAMRGDNHGFAHATAFHEMIPGHNLQGYINQRYSGYRANLGAGTPFYVEGWALYWELMLYDKGFDMTPEEKVGAMFWRMHRCARIIFSLKFHMGQWSPQEAIDFLVDRVGHERDNATAEVRRSFQGGYGPLYQAAYLLGGLELKGLRHELVDSKQMTEKAFHDEILRQGSMPIALLRLALTRQKLTRDMPIDWQFYGDLPDQLTSARRQVGIDGRTQRVTHEVVVLIRGHAALTTTGNLRAAATVTLIKGAPNLLVDTGDCWQREEILDALQRSGVAPEAIEYVVITHGHLDHIGNNNLFPHATFVLDTDVARDGEYWIHDFSRGPLAIDTAAEGEPIRVVATPGHTNHDVSVVVTTPIGIVAVVGDLFERDEDWIDNAWQHWSKDPIVQQASRDKMLALADHIVPGHGDIFPVRRPA